MEFNRRHPRARNSASIWKTATNWVLVFGISVVAAGA